jgi:hypothetical protein
MAVSNIDERASGAVPSARTTKIAVAQTRHRAGPPKIPAARHFDG